MSEQSSKSIIGWEIFNSISHGIGVIIGIVFLVLFILKGIALKDSAVLASYIVYGSAFIFMYACSTIYHAIPKSKAKSILRIFDHSAIFIFIAGSYTPVALYVLDGVQLIVFLTAVWLCALSGLLFKIITFRKYDSLIKISTLLYLLMGWLAVFFIRPLIQDTSVPFLALIVAGGLLYSFGTYFYKRTAKLYNHGIWHLFVLSASLCHLVAIYFYLG